MVAGVVKTDVVGVVVVEIVVSDEGVIVALVVGVAVAFAVGVAEDVVEVDVVKTRIWPPSGTQPTTAMPVLQTQTASGGQTRCSLSCDTDGASIGYRKPGEEQWNVYTEPFSTNADKLEIVAHRIGWKPSGKTVPVSAP